MTFSQSCSVAALTLVACSTPAGDPPKASDAGVLGTGARLSEVRNPCVPGTETGGTCTPNPNRIKSGDNANISAAIITAIDTFDETKDGKSKGTVYIQDVASTADYSGISLFSPSYVPASLRAAEGDVFDFTGEYLELGNVGTAVFRPDYLIQLSRPSGTFRYEYRVPEPRKATVDELSVFASGQKYLGMLVTLENVTVVAATTDSRGRVTFSLSQQAGAVAISNELFDLPATSFAVGDTIKKVTGIVTWFFSYKVAPRSMADVER